MSLHLHCQVEGPALTEKAKKNAGVVYSVAVSDIARSSGYSYDQDLYERLLAGCLWPHVITEDRATRRKVAEEHLGVGGSIASILITALYYHRLGIACIALVLWLRYRCSFTPSCQRR